MIEVRKVFEGVLLVLHWSDSGRPTAFCIKFDALSNETGPHRLREVFGLPEGATRGPLSLYNIDIGNFKY